MISVIIPTYNAELYLPKLLFALKSQTISHELIVIDSESNDNTHGILNSWGVQYALVEKSTFNHGETRNYGLSLSKHEYVVFLTQDALPAADDSLEKLVNHFLSDDRIAMAYGRQLPYPDTDVFGRFARLNNYPVHSLMKDKSMIPELGIKTCSSSNSFAIYKKSLLEIVGRFPNDTILGEDVTATAKFILKGYKVLYCADAQVYHSHNYSIEEEFKRYFDIGVFHCQQKLILKEFTSAESEGLRYVLEESKFLIRSGNISKLPVQFIRAIAKYVGYKAGRLYQIFPKSLNKKLSMHRSFW